MATEADYVIPESISITKHKESPGIVKTVGTISEKEIKPEDAKLPVEAEENPQCVEQEAEKGSETIKGDQNSEDQGFSGVEDIKPNSAVHEGEVESDLVVKTAPVTDETATSKDDAKIIANVEEERQVTEDDIREEKVVKESDNTSIVKCEEGEQGDGTQKTREFSDEENKENETPEEKVFETVSKEQEIGERALREVYTVADAPHVYVRAEENLGSKESLLQKQIPTTDETSLGVEDTNVHAEENLESKDKLEERIPTAAEEDFSSSNGRLEKQIASSNPDAETENKEPDDDVERSEEIVNTSAVKGEETSSPRDLHNYEGEKIEEKEIQKTEEYSEQEKKEENDTTKEKAADLSEYREEKNLEEQDIGEVPSSLIAEEKTEEIAKGEEIFERLKEAEEEKKEIEDVYVQAEENFDSNESLLEKQIPTAADEDVYVQAEENFESIEKLEEQIPATADEHETSFKETLSTDEASLETEHIDVNVGETKEKLEEQILTAENGGETFLKEAEEESNQRHIAPEDSDVKGEEGFNSQEDLERKIPAAAGEDETRLKEAEVKDREIVDGQAKESLESKENLEEKISTAAEAGSETLLKEPEVENKEPVNDGDIVVEEKGLATIVADEKALEIEDVGEQVEENFTSAELENQIRKAADSREGLLKEAEAKNEEQTESTDVAPEDIDACFDPKQKLEKQIPATTDERETRSKEDEAENKEQVKKTDVVHEEEGLETILTDKASLNVEDVDDQAEESLETNEIPTAADESESLLKEDGVENKEQIKDSDITVEVKGLETSTVVDEKGLDIEDVGVQVEESLSTEEKLESQIPATAEESETEAENNEQIKNENVGMQVEESFNLEEKFENPIQKAPEESETKEAKEENCEQVKNIEIAPQETVIAATSTDETYLGIKEVFVEPKITSRDLDRGEILEDSQAAGVGESSTCETTLKEREPENTEEVISTDVVPEEKDLTEAIFTNETSLDVEETDLSLKDEAEEENKEQVKNIVHEGIHVEDGENIASKENLEEKIPKAADEGEMFLKEAEAENKEQIENTGISHEGIEIESTGIDHERIDIKGEESFDSKENLEKQIPTTADDHRTCLREAEPENKEVNNADIVHEDKGVVSILTEEASLEVEDIDEQVEESLESKQNLEEMTAADEGETFLKEAEAGSNEQVKSTVIDVKPEASESKEQLEKEIPTAADETEPILKEAGEEQIKDSDIADQVSKSVEKGEIGFQEEIKNDIAPQEKVLETIPKVHRTTSNIDEGNINVQEEENLHTKEIPTAADEGEEKTVEQSFQVQSLEAETELGVEDEKGSKIVEEVFDEPKITSRDFGTSETIEFTQDPIEEEILKDSETAGVAKSSSCETSLKEREEENMEQVKSSDIVPEEKDLTEAITFLDIGEINAGLKDAEEENKEQGKSIVHEGIHVEEENIESKEELEEKIPKTTDEGEVFLKEAEAENKEQIRSADTVPEDTDENFNSQENLEQKIPTTQHEHETSLKDADIVPEEKGLASILMGEASKGGESLESKEKLEEQIPEETVNEGEMLVKEFVENEEQIKDGDIAVAKTLDIEEEEDETEADNNEQVKNDVAPQEKILKESEENNEDNGADEISEGGLPHEPEEPKTESSGENSELVACTKEETTIHHNSQESPHNENTEENEAEVEEILKESDIAGVGETETQKSEEILDTAMVKCEEGTNQVNDNDREEEAFTVKSAEDDGNQERTIQKTQGDSDQENKENVTAKEAADLSRNVVEEYKKEEASEKVSCLEDTARNENLKKEEENVVPNLKEESVKEPALDEPKSTIGDLNGGQSIEGNATTITPESVQEKTVEILKESQAAGVDESTIVERSEETVNVSSLKYEEDQPGEETLFQQEESQELNASELVLEKVEDIDEHEEESLESKENLEAQIPAAAGGDGGDIFFKEAEVERNEQITTAEDRHETNLTNPDIVHEEKGIETFSKDETSLEVEDIDVKALESESKENLEKQTPTEVDETETFLKEAEAENNEKSLEEEETKVGVEDDSYQPEDHHHPEKNVMIVEEVQEEAVKKSQENNKEVESMEKGSLNIQERNADEISPEFIQEDGSEKFRDARKDAVEFEDEIVKKAETAEMPEEIVDTSQVKCEGGQLGDGNIPYSEKAPTVSESDSQSIDGHEASVNDAEAENKERVKNTDVVHEEKGVETILTGERPLEVEDIDVKGEESESKENLEKIPIEAADESETLLKEAEAENKEQKDQETIVAHEKTLDIEEENFNSEENLEHQNCKASEEGEDKIADQQSFKVKSLEEAETKVGVEDKILKEEQTAEKSEEIVDVSQVGCEESQLGEGNIPDPDKSAMEDESRDREIFPVKVAEKDDEKNGAVTDSVQASKTSLEEVGDREAPELVSEKLDVDATEDEIIEGPEIVPRSDSHQSIDVASKDEVITYQSLHEKISAEELQKPSATLRSEEIEVLKPSQHKDIDVPVDGNKGDLLATRSAEDKLFQKEEPGELGASEFVLEKLDAGETEEEIKEALEPVLKSDSQNSDAVSKDEIIADQSVLGTKITEVSLDEKEGELFAAKEEPRELKNSELAPAKLDADETKEEIKEAFETVSKSRSQGTDVVSKDKAICYQALHEILVPEENEIKVSQCEIGTTMQDKNIEEKHKNEVEIPDDKSMEVALSQKEGHKDVEVSQSGTKETYEPTPEFASQSVDVATKEEILSSTLLTDKTSDVPTLTNTAEAMGFLKEEPRELKASDFELQISPEIQRGGSSELLEEQGSSLKEVPKVEEEERVDDSPDSSNLDNERSDKASEFGFMKSQEATTSEIRSGVATEANETTKNEVSNEEVHEVHENGSQGGKAEKLVKSGDTSATDHIPYGIKGEDEELLKGSEPDSITEDNHQGKKAIEDEIIEASDLVSKSDSHQSIDVDSKDEIITYQTQLHEDVVAEQIQIPSATLLPEEIQELKPSQHKHETATQDKNAEEECTEEKEVLVAERGEPLAPKVSELAPIKLDADETEEETKEISEPVSKFDSQSTDVVSKDEIISYQALHQGKKAIEDEIIEASDLVSKSDSHQSIDVDSKDEIITYQTQLHEDVVAEQIQIPSATLLPEEIQELKPSQHKHETATQDKNAEEECTEEKEVLVAERGEPLAPKVSELAPIKLDADETEEETKEISEPVSKFDSQSTDVVSKDEIISYQALHQGKKAIEDEIIEASDLVSKSDSHQSIDVDSKDEIITYQTQLHEDVVAEQIQIPSATLLPEEIQELKPSQHKHETATQDKNAEEECTEEKEVLVAERGEPLAPKVSELAPIKLDADETEEETKEISEPVSKFDSQSTDVVSKDEIISYQALHEILVPKEKEIKVSECELGTTVQDKNIEAEHKHELDIPDDKNMEEKLVQTEEPKDVEVSDLALKTADARAEPREDEEEERFDDLRLENLHIETSDDKASDFAQTEGFIKSEDAISDSKAEENQCETTTKENKIRKNEASNDQEVEGKELQKDSEPESIAEEIHQQNQATDVEDHGEKTNERTNENQNKGIAREKYERQLTFEDIRIRSNDPLFVENKTTQEQEGTVEDAAFEFSLQNEEDEVKSKTSTTATQVEKGSIAEASQQGILGFEEDNETSQDIKKPAEAHLTEEKDSTANKELQAEKEEDGEHENVEEVKTDEEKGEDEHENSGSGYDAPVIVEASKDSDATKVSSHKKSHNILSGIKHSISKVKKAITGKSSSHSKIQTEK